MEDPWGSPWNTDAPTGSLGTILPTAFAELDDAAQGQPNEVPSTIGSQWETDVNAWQGWSETDARDNNAWSKGVENASPGISLGGWTDSIDFGREANNSGKKDGIQQKVSTERDFETTISLAQPFETRHPAENGFEAASTITPRADESKLWADLDASEATSNDGAQRTESLTEEAIKVDSDQLTAVETGPEKEPNRSVVQELVQKYDGLASQRGSTTNISTNHDEETTPSDANIRREEIQPRSSDEEDSNAVTGTTFSSSVRESAKEFVSQTEDLAKSPMTPAVAYPVDLTHLDDLFPETTVASPQSATAPDIVMSDNFTTTSERKAWYRVSRFGSMRKHDRGNDEHYVRINWMDSEVRQKTIRIVRRWMEEDSIAGRVVLGGKAGAIGASMFNWNSSEPPIEIGELLKRRLRTGHIGHARNHSMPVTDSPAVMAPEWTLSVPSTPSEVVPPRLFAPQLVDRASVSDLASSQGSVWDTEQTSSTRLKRPSPIVPPDPYPVQGARAIHAIGSVEDDDEDEWGEMVSSPTVGASNMPKPQSLVSATLQDISGSTEPTSTNPVQLEPTVPQVSKSNSSSDLSFDHWGSFGETSTFTSSPYPPITQNQTISSASADQTSTPNIPRATSHSGMLAEVSQSSFPKHATTSNTKIIEDILRGLPDLTYMLR